MSRQSLFSIDDIAGTAPYANFDTRIVVLQNLPELVRQLREANPPAR